MKKKSIIIVIAIAFIAIVCTIFNLVESYASAGSLFVNLEELDTGGKGYAINDPKNAGSGNYIWNIITHDNEVGSASAKQRNLYCVKGNYGNTWNSKEDTILNYNMKFDLQAERNDLVNKATGAGAETIKDLLNPQKECYRQLLWLLDNAYVSGTTNKDNYLANAGIFKEDDGTYYDKEENLYNYVLTDEDIKAVERVAIWYFTNYKLDNEDKFNLSDKEKWLRYTTDGETYTELSQLGKFHDTSGQDRSAQVEILYKYLIDQAQKNTGN